MVRHGETIYIGGSFTQVGRATGGAVAIDTGTGAAQHPYPKVVGSVHAVAPDGSGGWYLGGSFGAIRGQARSGIAHVDAGGALTAWNPNANGTVYALAVSGGTVYVGGLFTSIGGQPRNYIAALDVVSGAATAESGANYWVGRGRERRHGLRGQPVHQHRRPAPAMPSPRWTRQPTTAWNRFHRCFRPAPLSLPWWSAGAHPTRAATSAASAGSRAASPRSMRPAADAPPDQTRTTASTPWRLIGGVTSAELLHQHRRAAPQPDGLVRQPVPHCARNPNAVRRRLCSGVSGGTVCAGGRFTSMGGQTRNYIAAVGVAGGDVTGTSGRTAVYALAVSGGTVYAGGAFKVSTVRRAIQLPRSA